MRRGFVVFGPMFGGPGEARTGEHVREELKRLPVRI
jgi:hypothetical protein